MERKTKECDKKREKNKKHLSDAIWEDVHGAKESGPRNRKTDNPPQPFLEEDEEEHQLDPTEEFPT